MSNEELISADMPSNRDQLARLDVNECLSRATVVDQPVDMAALNGIKLTYRRTWSAAIARAKALTDFEYTMETFEQITGSGTIYCVMVITRTM